jgi:hypothetical protein
MNAVFTSSTTITACVGMDCGETAALEAGATALNPVMGVGCPLSSRVKSSFVRPGAG